MAEINTLKGNVNWMKIHEQDMSSNLFDNLEDLKPVITPGNSDSAALDNVFELLMHSGKPVPFIKLMMMPDAWSKEVKFYQISPADVLNSTIEPWDGPAAICATDSKWAIAATDRNGLRPLGTQLLRIRYFMLDPETGWYIFQKAKLFQKVDLAGQLTYDYLKKGKIYKDKEIKDYST